MRSMNDVTPAPLGVRGSALYDKSRLYHDKEGGGSKMRDVMDLDVSCVNVT